MEDIISSCLKVQGHVFRVWVGYLPYGQCKQATFCFLILESNGVELYTCEFHVVLTKAKKMTPLLSESNESEIFDREPV